MKNKSEKQIKEFLRESNHIEREYGDDALEDALFAWEYAMSVDKMTTSSILEIHRLLAHRINPRIAGQLRTCPVRIGGQIKQYLGREVLLLALDDVCKVLAATISAVPVADRLDLVTAEDLKSVVAKELHIVFEDIHPFEDGNGRVGRILYNWHRLKMGLPIHVIHADWPDKDGEQASYYQWFRQDK